VTRRLLLSFGTAVAFSLTTGCCECDRPDSDAYTISLTSEERPDDLVSPVWGGDSPILPSTATVIRVGVPRGTELLAAPALLEFYRDGEAVEVPRARLDGRPIETGLCPVDLIEYRFRGLPAGYYQMVHRRDSVPAGLRSSFEGSWGRFDGDVAVSTRLYHAGPAPDGGVLADAGS